MPELTVNGEKRTVAAGATVADLLTQLGVKARFLVVERNGEPIARDAFAATALAEGDRLEIVSPVGGG